MFDQQDFDQIHAKGIEVKKIEKEIRFFRTGFPFIRLVRPAKINDGIKSLNIYLKDSYINIFEVSVKDLRIVKFVPASGAASRMFKHLFEFWNQHSDTPVSLSDYPGDQGFNSVHYLFSHLPEIAFYPTLKSAIGRSGLEINNLVRNNEYSKIAEYILSSAGLNYSNLPKALIQFHSYPREIRTSAEEHLVEAANYARGTRGTARIHFTISPEHKVRFDTLFKEVLTKYEQRFNTRMEISYSIQKPSTDTIAVDESNEPFRDSSGRLLFRPGGHGALLQNLNEIDADLIFIKNIDNIVPDRLKKETFTHKKMIGGYLIHLKNKISEFLLSADSGELSVNLIEDTAKFAENELNINLPNDFNTLDITGKINFLKAKLNRPIRVCGMVRNEGEPGGGPFWVSDSKNNLSLQIVESSQIDFSGNNQMDIFQASTHFNPVDIVCCINDYKGKPFDLQSFVDEDTGLISHKSTEGRTLKAQELPGLWNGAMSDWITIFAEVPIVTFNPVKTVNDLLRKEHLSYLSYENP